MELKSHVSSYKVSHFHIVSQVSKQGKLAIFVLAFLISLHYNINKNRVKLATFKTRNLNYH